MVRWLKRGSLFGTLGKDALISTVRYVVIDTELTSLDAKSNRLLSVGAISMTGGRIHVGEQFYRVVNPGVSVPTDGVKIHKLRPSDIEKGASPEKVLGELQPFIEEAVLVGHFAEIDIKVLRKELAQIGQELKNRAICTARVHRWLVKNQPYTEDQFRKLEASDLATLARAYHLGAYNAHHALDDAFLTARLWQKLLHELRASGIKTLGQLMKIGGI